MKKTARLKTREILLLGIAISVAGFIGLWILNKNSPAPPHSSPVVLQSDVDSADVTAAQKQYDSYVTPTETEDTKHAIIQGLDTYCQTMFAKRIQADDSQHRIDPTQFMASRVTFDSSGGYRRKDGFVTITTGCTTPQITEADRYWSDFNALVHLHSGVWVVDDTYQTNRPHCSSIDGLHYPPEVVAACYTDFEYTKFRRPH